MAKAGSLYYMRGYMVRGPESPEEGHGPIRFLAATEGAKRDGLNLLMEGLDLDRFRANPVILWAHNYWAPPIGRGVQAFTEGARLFVDVEFDRADPFAVSVEQKYRRGYLNGVSVGFDPLKVVNEEGEEVPWWEGGDVESWELLEVSTVPVPMDPEALVDSGRQALRSLATDRGIRELLSLFTEAQRAVSGRVDRQRLTQARDLISEVLGAGGEGSEEWAPQAGLDALGRLRDALRLP